MVDLSNIIKGRRSIRRYEERAVPDEHLRQILESIQWSPSWANTQCWEVVVVKDQALKERLKEALAPTNPASKGLTEAPVILVLCGRLGVSGFYHGKAATKLGDWFMFDLGIAVQSLCLTAHHLGLGTVIAGLINHAKVKEILGVPEGFETAVLIPLGYPAKGSPAPPRREIKEFIHSERF